jgi:GntR family transcriptional regulator
MSLVDRGAAKLIQASDIEEGTVAYLSTKLGLSQAGYRYKITVRAPDANEATFFELPDDGRVAVFEILRTAFDDDGQPLWLTVSVYPVDKNQLAIDVGRVPMRPHPLGDDTRSMMKHPAGHSRRNHA